jgi:hypothetical protein
VGNYLIDEYTLPKKSGFIYNLAQVIKSQVCNSQKEYRIDYSLDNPDTDTE